MDYLHFLEKEIHTTIMATVDDKGLPVTCAIDIMDSDKNGLYFLTAKGKNFYKRLKKQKYIALTGMKGTNTLSYECYHSERIRDDANRKKNLFDESSIKRAT